MRRGSSRKPTLCSLSRFLRFFMVVSALSVGTLIFIRLHRKLQPNIEENHTPINSNTSPVIVLTHNNNSIIKSGRQNHALFTKPASITSLEDTFVYLQQQTQCKDSPIFVTMASVESDIYWQLIENFMYTMERFNVLPCALMICVSDDECYSRCQQNDFPCYNYKHELTGDAKKLPHTMEQIAHLKLYYIPQALARGVDVFTLDLDVGFYDNPMTLIQNYKQSPSDAFVQEDVVFIMHRSVARWKEWWTEPMPNIGLMLCKGNQHTVDMFRQAWQMYLAITKESIKTMPGKDQNKVVESMKRLKRQGAFNYEYFPNSSAVLIDKLWKFVNISIELGGEVAQEILRGMDPPTVAIHTTCYEQRTKVMGLKALSAFWTPQYYVAHRRTVTKLLLYIDHRQIGREIQSLGYIAYKSERAWIVPNVLGHEDMTGQYRGGEYRGRRLWPGFRVVYVDSPALVEILEPAYYWRIEQLGRMDGALPPKILSFNANAKLDDIAKVLKEDPYPRIVLYIRPASPVVYEEDSVAEARLTQWASHSVGLFDDFPTEQARYGVTPYFKNLRSTGLSLVRRSVGPCLNIFEPYRGNRSCFEVCDPPF